MTDVPDTTSAGGKTDSIQERVGDVLRKERITKRIALETVARDLKLNVKYIKALEANDHDNLPADPYIRVYLRSLAKYLSLDAEEVLKRFYGERGIPPEKYQKDLSTKLDITVIERDRPFGPWLAVALIVAILSAVTFYAGKRGWISIPSEENLDSVAAVVDTLDAQPTVPDSLLPQPDSFNSGQTSGGQSDGRPAFSDSAAVGIASRDTAAAVGIKLVIRADVDSVWIQAFTDGRPWKNTLRPNSTKLFYARDSLNLHIGNSRAVKYFLNGKSWRKAKGSGGVVHFKLDASGRFEDWTPSKWQSVFQGRL